MLSLNFLEAVLQGLSPVYIDHLDQAWMQFCFRIQRAMQDGHRPLDALKLALSQATYLELRVIGYSVLQAKDVLPLTDLSYRQKELLVALRSKSINSVTELSFVLNWDRSHTHRRLQALIHKGYAQKFYDVGGPRYFAIERRLEKSVKYRALQLILDFVEQRLKSSNGSTSSPATGATNATRATDATQAIRATLPPGVFSAADILNPEAMKSLSMRDTD